jgi:hypothetical protein
VSTELQVDLDPSIKRRFGTVADDARVTRTAAALEANGISVLRAADGAEAKRIVLGLIPDGSQVHHGASQSLEVSGIIDEIERSARFDPVRPRIRSLASMGGSQLGPYASGAGRVILVVGTQRFVWDLQEGLRRINEYAFPLEDAAPRRRTASIPQ